MSALYEYKQFLIKNFATLSDREKEVANLILDNFTNVSAKSKHGGSRSKYIYELINNNFNKLNSNLYIAHNEKKDAFKLSKVTRLVTKNFRGFQEEIIFDLQRPYAFIFGENGSGKSSFFEAIEYSLTGQISEAKAKRYEVAKYATNVESQLLDYPKLYGVFSCGNEEKINADISKHSSVLFEKNRIEGFSKVSSFTKTIQQERLSILFGLDDFSNFCTNFSSISNSIPQENRAAKKLLESNEKIKYYEEIIKQKDLDLTEIKKAGTLLLLRFPDCKNSAELLLKIQGNEEQIGLLKNKQNELTKLENVKKKDIDISVRFLQYLDELKKLIMNVDNCTREVQKFKNELSLKSLYELILKTKHILDNTKCPACQSDIYGTDGSLILKENPFVHSEEMLKSLVDIQAKEQLLVDSQAGFKRKLPALIGEAQVLNNMVKNKLAENIRYDDFESLKNNFNELQKFGYLAKEEIESFNKELELKLKEKHKLKEEVKGLDDLKTKLIELRKEYQLTHKDIQKNKLEVSALKESNIPLIKESEKGQRDLLKIQEIDNAYISFTDKLKKHNENLPIEFSKDLSELTLTLYNSINSHPYDYETLKSLSLPTKPEGQITISYLDGTKADALNVLSEGHLKCLGLSILLAKNIKDKQNVLVFDDVVNAIDDEHRKGVRDTLFHNVNLKNHQLIITTHASDFLKYMENMVDNYRENAIRYDFCNKTDGRKITLKNANPSNTIIKARQYLENNDRADCLMQIRRTLEFLSPVIWKKIANKQYNSAMSLMFHSPNLAPNLNNYLSSLNKKLNDLIKKSNAAHFVRHQKILEEILNLNDQHKIVNHYLNKGTHYEELEEEFDDRETEKLLALVEELNKLVLAK